MKQLEIRRLGGGPLAVTTIGLGGTSLGNMYSAVDEGSALAVVEAAHSAGIRLIDTAPVYGFGLSEIRIGAALKHLPRDSFVISSKVGYCLVPLPPGQAPSSFWPDAPRLTSTFDFSRDATLRSIENSLTRLGVDRIDMIAIHDPDESVGFDLATGTSPKNRFREAMQGAYPVLDDMRRQGLIGAVGVGMNQWQMLEDFAREGEFDYFLVAGRYTLLEQTPLSTLLPLCVAKGIKVIVGGPYNSGILAMGALEGAYYNYAPATPEILTVVGRIEQVCARYGISLRAAALQFPLLHEAVVSVIPGSRSRGELQENLDSIGQTIPASFWQELKSEGLLDSRSP